LERLKAINLAKTLFNWNEAFSKPVGLYMEMVPLVNPLALKVGDTFPVLVLKEGIPLANAGFESSDEEEPSYKTDAYGIAQIPVKKKGLFIVAAKYYAQQVCRSVCRCCDDSKQSFVYGEVDATSLDTSLSFVDIALCTQC